jgi:hypothetical protein
VTAEQDEDAEPVEGVDEADGDIDVVLEAVAVVDVEVEELAAHQGAGKRGARRGAPHQFVQVFRIQADHVGMPEQAGGDEGEHGVGGRQQDFGGGFEGFRLEAVLERGALELLGDGDVDVAGVIEAVGVPGQSLGLLDGALDLVAERSGPIDGELRPQRVADADRVGQPLLGVGRGRQATRRRDRRRIRRGGTSR